jgi:hypothetical protein
MGRKSGALLANWCIQVILIRLIPSTPLPYLACVSRIRDLLSMTYRQFVVGNPLRINILHISQMKSTFYQYQRKIFHPKELHVKYCFHRTYAERFFDLQDYCGSGVPSRGSAQATDNDPPSLPTRFVKELSRAARWVRSAKRHHTPVLAQPGYRVGPTDGKYARHPCV